MSYETVSDAIQRYERIGYTERFDPAPGGLCSAQTGMIHPAHALVPEHVVVLGSPTPDGPVLFFALRSQRDGTRGTWVVARNAVLPREAQRLVDRLARAHPQPARPRRVGTGRGGAGEFVLEGLLVGVIGASILALWFLLLDAMQRDPLFTPLLSHDRLFRHHTLPIELVRVSTMVALHGASCVPFGIVAAWLVSRRVRRPPLPGLFLALFAALEGAFLVGSELVIPGAARAIGHAPILVGNGLAAFAMALTLRRSEPRPAHPHRTERGLRPETRGARALRSGP